MNLLTLLLARFVLYSESVRTNSSSTQTNASPYSEPWNGYKSLPKNDSPVKQQSTKLFPPSQPVTPNRTAQLLRNVSIATAKQIDTPPEPVNTEPVKKIGELRAIFEKDKIGSDKRSLVKSRKSETRTIIPGGDDSTQRNLFDDPSLPSFHSSQSILLIDESNEKSVETINRGNRTVTNKTFRPRSMGEDNVKGSVEVFDKQIPNERAVDANFGELERKIDFDNEIKVDAENKKDLSGATTGSERTRSLSSGSYSDISSLGSGDSQGKVFSSHEGAAGLNDQVSTGKTLERAEEKGSKDPSPHIPFNSVWNARKRLHKNKSDILSPVTPVKQSASDGPRSLSDGSESHDGSTIGPGSNSNNVSLDSSVVHKVRRQSRRESVFTDSSNDYRNKYNLYLYDSKH